MRTKSLTVSGKTGTRTIPLAPASLELFARLARDKLPAAYLLTGDDGKRWSHSDWDELVLDRELAASYGVQTRTLNQAVKRNARALPQGLHVSPYRGGGGGLKITVRDLEAHPRPEHQVLAVRLHRARP